MNNSPLNTARYASVIQVLTATGTANGNTRKGLRTGVDVFPLLGLEDLPLAKKRRLATETPSKQLTLIITPNAKMAATNMLATKA